MQLMTSSELGSVKGRIETSAEDENYEAASERSFETKSGDMQPNELTLNEESSDKVQIQITASAKASHAMRRARFRRFLFDSCRELGIRRDEVFPGRVLDINEYRPPPMQINIVKRRKSVTKRALKSDGREQEDFMNSSPYSERMPRPKRKIYGHGKKKIVVSRYAKYFSLNRETDPKPWPRRLAVKGNIDFNFRSYEKEKLLKEDSSIKWKLQDTVTVGLPHIENGGNVTPESDELNDSRRIVRDVDEFLAVDKDIENILIDKLLENTAEIWKSYSSAPEMTETLKQDFPPPASRTGKRNTYDGNARDFEYIKYMAVIGSLKR